MLKRPFLPYFPYYLDEIAWFERVITEGICDLDSCKDTTCWYEELYVK